MIAITYRCGSPKTIMTQRVKVLGHGNFRVLTCVDTNSVKHSFNLKRIIEVKVF